MTGTARGRGASRGDEAPVNHPVMNFEWFLNDTRGEINRWEASTDFFIWRGCFPADAPPFVVWEKVAGGVVRIPVEGKTYLMHMIHAGTPHHIDHLFGYWRICDLDTIYVRTVQGDDADYMLAVGGNLDAYRADGLAWYCPQCANELVRHSVAVSRARWRDFWDRQLTLVRAFNADEGVRTCPECGHLHPPGFGFDPADDTAEERLQREAW